MFDKITLHFPKRTVIYLIKPVRARREHSLSFEIDRAWCAPCHNEIDWHQKCRDKPSSNAKVIFISCTISICIFCISGATRAPVTFLVFAWWLQGLFRTYLCLSPYAGPNMVLFSSFRVWLRQHQYWVLQSCRMMLGTPENAPAQVRCRLNQ